jgi:hypothetical protein
LSELQILRQKLAGVCREKPRIIILFR